MMRKVVATINSKQISKVCRFIRLSTMAGGQSMEAILRERIRETGPLSLVGVNMLVSLLTRVFFNATLYHMLT